MLRFTGVAVLSAVGGREWRNGEWMGAKGAAGNPAAPQAVKKPTESSRGPRPSRFLIVPGGVYGGCGAIFAAENPIFQSKNRFLAVFAPGNLKDFSKNW